MLPCPGLSFIIAVLKCLFILSGHFPSHLLVYFTFQDYISLLLFDQCAKTNIMLPQSLHWFKSGLVFSQQCFKMLKSVHFLSIKSTHALGSFCVDKTLGPHLFLRSFFLICKRKMVRFSLVTIS